MSKRLLVLDTCSNVLDFCMRAMDYGWDVQWWDQPRKKDNSHRLAGTGIVPKISDYHLIKQRYLDWADLIFLPDNTAYLDMLEPYRQQGYPILGPSKEAAELELDRKLGQQAMKKAGLKTIDGIEFNDYDKAIKFVEKNQTYLVSKPSGDADKALSYVAPRYDALIAMFERWKTNEKYRNDARKHGFILQEKITGAEFAVGGWFGPGGWSKWWYENIEYKKVMAGDLGQNCGEMGTLSKYTDKSKLADLALKPMTKQLEALDYVGFIDISGMIDEKGEFWPFEFTMRPGWPSFHNQMATHIGDPVQWMCDLLVGSDTLQVSQDCCISLVMAIPDFPTSHLTNKEVSGYPIYNATDRDHVHLSEVMIQDNVPIDTAGRLTRMPYYVTAGDYVMVVTGTGETITSARYSAYAAINKIKMPGSPFWRPDIGRAHLIKGLPILQKNGYAKGFSY